MTTTITKQVVEKFDAILSRGLCSGVGRPNGQMCIEAAVVQALGLPFGDNLKCVEPAIRSFKITLNDSRWSSPQARAAGLRDLGIAQIGSMGVVDGKEFVLLLSIKTIKVLIPALFREVFPSNVHCLNAATKCEEEGTAATARYADDVATTAADADTTNDAARYAAAAALYAAAIDADAAAAYAARYANYTNFADKYLLLSAKLALDVLRELKSPGCEWIGL